MFKKLIVAATMLLTFAGQSYAVPVNGDIVFNGGTATTDTSDLATAQTVTFGTGTTVLGGTGAFASVAPGSAVTFNIGTLDLTSFSGPTLFASFGDFTFTLESVSSSVSTIAGNDFLSISGRGIFDDGIGGYEADTGIFNISIQEPGFGNEPMQFSFSSSASVPEPTSLALLGAGLIGLGFARRKTK